MYVRACTPYFVTKGLDTREKQKGGATWRMSRVSARGHAAAISAKQRGVVHTSPTSSASLSRQLCASFGGSASAQDLSGFQVFPGSSPTPRYPPHTPAWHEIRRQCDSACRAGPRLRFVSKPRASHTARRGTSTPRGLTRAAARRRSMTSADGGIFDERSRVLKPRPE